MTQSSYRAASLTSAEPIPLACGGEAGSLAYSSKSTFKLAASSGGEARRERAATAVVAPLRAAAAAVAARGGLSSAESRALPKGEAAAGSGHACEP